MYKKTLSAILSFVIIISSLSSSIALADGLDNRTSDISASTFDFTEPNPFQPISQDATTDLTSMYPVLNLPVVSANKSNTNFALDTSILDSELQSTAPSMNRAGQYLINENYLYSHSLSSAQDWNIYICEITTTGYATAILRSSSAMDFNMIVQVYDSTFTYLLSEDTSNIKTAIYSGQSIRKYVTAGQYLVIGAEADGNTFVANSYQVGVVRQAYISQDVYEPNNHPDNVDYLGVLTPSQGILSDSYTLIDSAYDVDWYSFDCSSQYKGYYPYLAFVADTGIKATLFTRATNGDMVKIRDLPNNGLWNTYNNATVCTYYVAVYSPTFNTGSYALGLSLYEIYRAENAVYVSFSSVNGDRPSKDYGNGTNPVVAQAVSGSITIKDSGGNPVSNFPIGINFRTYAPLGNDAVIGQAVVTTGSTGVAYFAINIPVWQWDGLFNFHHYYMKPYEVYRNYADLMVIMVAVNYNNYGTTAKAIYHYGAEDYVG